MLKTISSSELCTQIKRVLSEVGCGQVQYVVEMPGKPSTAIVSIEDFRVLQQVKQRRATASLREIIANVRYRTRALDPDELNAWIEEARTEFCQLRNGQAAVD